MIKKVIIDKANRIYQQPPSLFAFKDDKTRPKLISKIKPLDLGSLRWNLSNDLITDKDNNKLAVTAASENDISNLKAAIVEWMESQYKVTLNPKKEIFITTGISQTIYNLAFAFVDPGDVVFVPELGLPAYRSAITSFGGEAVSYGMNYKNNWLPNLEPVYNRLGRVARILILNSPHNPTGVSLNDSELDKLIFTASKEHVLIINDAAYQSLDQRKTSSLLSAKQAKKVGLELYSFSYNFGLPKIPFGFAIGNRDIIHGLKQAERFHQNFIPKLYVEMALEAIRKYPSENLTGLSNTFKKNRASVIPLLDLLDLELSGYETIPFVWAKIDKRTSSTYLASQLYRRSRILVVPGSAFGDSGEGFLRISLTAETEEYKEACERIKKKIKIFKPKEDDEE